MSRLSQRTTSTCRADTTLLIASILLAILCVTASTERIEKSRLLPKLCSSQLSDALYIVCRDRGYNSPFSLSDENQEDLVVTGPGLVDECCLHHCTYATLERYCKPLPKDKLESRAAVIEESYIVKLPSYSVAAKELSSEERPRAEVPRDSADPIKSFTRS